MKSLTLFLLPFAATLFAQGPQPDFTPDTELAEGEQHMLFSFPSYVAQPDGMAMDADGNVYVSSPNFNAKEYPGLIFRIAPDYTWSILTTVPAPEGSMKAGPMGMSFGPDGNLYVADNQYNFDKNYKSRILRINLKDGKTDGIDVVATGLKHPNALRWHENALYVTDSKWETEPDSVSSGIWRFPLEALNDSLHVEPSMTAEYLLDTFTAIRQPNGKALGTDGMDFDSEGNLFVGMFSDGRMFKLSLDEDGSVASKEVFLEYGTIPSCDGVIIDKDTDLIYLADSEANAIRVVTPDGKVETLAENVDTDGSDGKMDQPCEPLIVGNKLFVANYDQPNAGFVNTKADAFYNMTIIRIPDRYLGTKQR